MKLTKNKKLDLYETEHKFDLARLRKLYIEYYATAYTIDLITKEISYKEIWDERRGSEREYPLEYYNTHYVYLLEDEFAYLYDELKKMDSFVFHQKPEMLPPGARDELYVRCQYGDGQSRGYAFNRIGKEQTREVDEVIRIFSGIVQRVERLCCLYGNGLHIAWRLGDTYIGDYALLTFHKDCVKFGRDQNNDIVLDYDFISRIHGQFQKSENGWYVFDDGSTNGLVYEGRKIKSHCLEDKNKILICGENQILTMEVSDLRDAIFNNMRPVKGTAVHTISFEPRS